MGRRTQASQGANLWSPHSLPENLLGEAGRKTSTPLALALLLAAAGGCNCGLGAGEIGDGADAAGGGVSGAKDGSAAGNDGGSAAGDDGGSGAVSDGGALSLDAGIVACASSSKKAELTPLDLMIVQDTSYSMDFDWKWVSVKSALKAFVTNPSFDGMGVAVEYFPARAQCRLSEYTTPAVSMGQLPGVASDFVESLEHQEMFGGTPMVQVLEGVYGYSKKWAADHPDRKLVVLLATDGIPDSTCAVMSDGSPGNSLENVVAVTSAAASTAPRIPTFVIGVGTELTALDQLAQAGGTAKALVVDANANTAGAFLQALNQIRGNALSCDMPIPAPDTATADYSKIALVFTPTAGSPQLFTQVPDATGCQSAPLTGWHYDDASAPTRLVLCDEACKQITSQSSGQLDLLVGCRTVAN